MLNLAVQTLSSGIRDAIDYLQTGGDPNFQNSDSTVTACIVSHL